MMFVARVNKECQDQTANLEHPARMEFQAKDPDPMGLLARTQSSTIGFYRSLHNVHVSQPMDQRGLPELLGKMESLDRLEKTGKMGTMGLQVQWEVKVRTASLGKAVKRVLLVNLVN